MKTLTPKDLLFASDDTGKVTHVRGEHLPRPAIPFVCCSVIIGARTD